MKYAKLFGLVALVPASGVADAQRATAIPRLRTVGPNRAAADVEVSLAPGQRADLGSLDLPELYRLYEGPYISNESDGPGCVRVGLVWDQTHYTAIYADADAGVAWVVEPRSTPIVPRMDVYLGNGNRLALFGGSFRGWVFNVGHDSHVYLPASSPVGGQLVLPDESRVDLYAAAPNHNDPPVVGPYRIAVRSGRGRAWTPLASPPPDLGCTADAYAPPGASGVWGPEPYISDVENYSNDPNSRAVACLEPNLTPGQPEWLTEFHTTANFVGSASLVVDADPAQGPPLRIELGDDIYMSLSLWSASGTGALPQPYLFQLSRNQHIVPGRFDQGAPSFVTQGGHVLWMNSFEPPGVAFHFGPFGGPVVITDYR